MRRPSISAAFLGLLLITTVAAPAQQEDWQARLAQILPLMGHRNWIMIVDSAYPLQSSSGVETLETNTDQLQVIQKVLSAINSSIHVRPIVYMDAELPFLPEKDAPGVTAYRNSIKTALAGDKITALPHEQLISKVDQVGRTFHVVILKTTMTVPYSSVFLELNCKYWSDDAEARLRQAMAAKP
jgi:L-fucose mutarotase/ribose pyranase (RbsD/FucU family)